MAIVYVSRSSGEIDKRQRQNGPALIGINYNYSCNDLYPIAPTAILSRTTSLFCQHENMKGLMFYNISANWCLRLTPHSLYTLRGGLVLMS